MIEGTIEIKTEGKMLIFIAKVPASPVFENDEAKESFYKMQEPELLFSSRLEYLRDMVKLVENKC